jgi:hypothetical protein
VIVWGDPIYISRDETVEGLEAKRVELEEKLVSLTEKADEMACAK